MKKMSSINLMQTLHNLGCEHLLKKIFLKNYRIFRTYTNHCLAINYIKNYEIVL